VTHVIK